MKWILDQYGNHVVKDLYGISGADFKIVSRPGRTKGTKWNIGYLTYKSGDIHISETLTVPVSVLGKCSKSDGQKKFTHLLNERQAFYSKMLTADSMDKVHQIKKAFQDSQNIDTLMSELKDLVATKDAMEAKYQADLMSSGKEIVVGYKDVVVCGEYLGMQKQQISVVSGETPEGFYSINDDLYSDEPVKTFYTEARPVYNTKTVMAPKFRPVTVSQPVLAKVPEPEMDTRYQTIMQEIVTLSKRIEACQTSI